MFITIKLKLGSICFAFLRGLDTRGIFSTISYKIDPVCFLNIKSLHHELKSPNPEVTLVFFFTVSGCADNVSSVRLFLKHNYIIKFFRTPNKIFY